MSEKPRVSHLAAMLVLVATCVLWATSFATVKICGKILAAGALPGTNAAFGTVLLTAVRFTLALPLVLIFWKSARAWRPKRGDLVPLLKVSVPMAVGFLVQAAGLAFTLATVSGFITGLCVCFTPGFEWLIHGRRPTWRLALGVVLAITGVGLMTLTGGERFSFGWGEVLTFICVLAFTVQIVYTGEVSEKLGAAKLTVGSFAFTALCGWIAALVMSPGSVRGALAEIFAGDELFEFWGYFAIIVVCATIGAMVLMNAFQRYVRPSEAAVVYTSEPVFAAVFALIFIGRGELLGAAGLAGAGLMLAANLLVALKKRRKPEAAPGAPIVPGGAPEMETAPREKR